MEVVGCCAVVGGMTAGMVVKVEETGALVVVEVDAAAVGVKVEDYVVEDLY